MSKHAGNGTGTSTVNPAGEVQPEWQVYPGRGVAVQVAAGSQAAGLVLAGLRAAERVMAALEHLLEPTAEQRVAPLTIVLVDSTDGVRASGESRAVDPHGVNLDQSVVLQMVGPELERESLTWLLTRLLVARWFGPRAALAQLFVEGIAGLVTARTGGPSVEAINAGLRAELDAVHSVTILPRDDSDFESSPRPHAGGHRAATSFVAFLLAGSGPAALRQLLAEYDPCRRDQAALAAYKRPLGALEAAWLADLRRPPAGLSAVRSLLGHLSPLIRPYWRRELEILAYMLFELAYGLAIPLASMYVVDRIIPSGSVQTLVLFVLGLLLIYVLNGAVGMRRAYVVQSVNERVLLDLRTKLFAHLQRLPQSFYNGARVGDVMARLFGDLDILGQALAQVAGVGVYLALRALVTAVALVWLNSLLGALVLVVVPLFGLVYLLLRQRLERLSYQLQSLYGDAEAATQENLSAQATIKAFGLEERAISSFQARLMALLRTSLRLTVVGVLFETSMGLAITMGQLVVIGVGAFLVMQGQLTVGTLLAFLGLLAALFQPVAMLSDVGQTIQRAAGSLVRVAELLVEPASADRRGAVPLARTVGDIRFERVAFGYGERPVLRDLSLTIPAGSHVAIVGPSGAGKSTLMNLLLRFWDPTEGRLLIAGQDLRDLQLASLRGQIGVVFQDPFIFDTTLRENIALGRPDATDAEIMAAARDARLHDFVSSLPAGYDTVVGERGVRMSGGQRQRVAIARALLRNPSLLILDEPTSALDARTEREIVAALVPLARGRTTISITHRLSLAAKADHIFVLADGRLVEQGSHAELVSTGGLYRQLYDEQASQMGPDGKQPLEPFECTPGARSRVADEREGDTRMALAQV